MLAKPRKSKGWEISEENNEEKNKKKYVYSTWSRIDYPTSKPSEVTETKYFNDGIISSNTTYESKGYSGEPKSRMSLRSESGQLHNLARPV